MKTKSNILRMSVCLFFLISSVLGFSACADNNGGQPAPADISTKDSAESSKTELVLENMPIEHETKFGGVYIKITINDFNALGFRFGDSLNITFSNGFELKDLPYYNGYYVDMGEALLVGYPGYPYIRTGYNNGEDMYVKAGLSETF